MKLAFSTLLFCTFSATTFAYQINVSELVAYQLGQQQIEQLMQKIYAPLGITPRLIILPSERGLEYVNEGVYDAEAGRTHAVAATYSNLLQVPEPLATVQMAVFCIKKEHCALSDQQDYVVIKGSLVTELVCKRKKLICNAVFNDVSVFQALQKGHVEQILADDLFALGTLCQSGLEKVYVRRLPDASYPIYHYVNVKHQALLPQLTKSIQRLNNNGESHTIFSTLEKHFSTCQGKVIELSPD
ncbi:transporter substrate-binding domain-containing protein [Pseudoalteromonas piscicida]|uniref:Uncharacterized protein n=1 Tax=Pseudoalteromonas piscicida TaxID=43662 RepID=A0A2A5JQI1_PSEO7|nr:transporter substrate-binding domain-containing protein [Pseudoalteromonas piscicida]PCK31650.1 hypothetical protein CEX98_11440 [Pseudoalteromonas piscicida]